MRALFAFIAGSLFGTGLLISGMTNTQKVIGWLDVFGNWDPTLAFVMGGAILPMAAAWAYSRGRSPKLGGTFPTPPEPKVGRNLVIGSTLFGAGWGLAGLCPGPSIASLSFGGTGGMVFVAFMLAGMILTPRLKSQLALA
ncbi:MULTISPECIES: DUF6691 family protein [Halocynthiibacter]|uniref:YeeE/YedE family protein n=1 Tax=Halocynthiibacter halioticoli TaxID=2986804 RepID=A0AAE3LPY9_9RHOB|nr:MULTISPECIES: DUF6691 family protein [Halocynthiibacter]MCV6823947.1 hypothetical protein [Halocynthiibacter halioticoli]MCW4056948.1 hypothetical protein [Halocynthiibacter sp. SDUM655004]